MWRSQSGWVAVWFLVVAALVVAVAIFAGGSQANAGEIALACAAVCVVLVGIALELRRDPWEVAAFGLAVGLVAAIVFGIIVAAVPGPAPSWSAVAIAGLALAALSGVALFRMARGREDVPNVLAERFGKGALLEADGVQMAVVGPGGANPGPTGAIQVFLQNCFDSARKVEIKADADSWTKRLVLEPRSEATLARLEVGVLTLPFRVRAGPADAVELTLSVSASGGGRRVRRWRARSATRKVSTAFQVIAALTGHLVTGGGIPVRIVVPEVAEGATTALLPERAWQSLWKPAGHEPLEAVRAAGLVRGDTRR